MYIKNDARAGSGRDHILVGFTNYYMFNSNPIHGEVYSIQHYVRKFVSDLRQVDGFLRVLRFPPPIKLIASISLKYCLRTMSHTIYAAKFEQTIIHQHDIYEENVSHMNRRMC
jgi:hypothetical protein